jgi:hypothetical protein
LTYGIETVGLENLKKYTYINLNTYFSKTMKTTSCSFLVTALLFLCNSGFVQGQYTARNAEDAVAILGGRICNSNFNFEFDGSPYLQDEFIPGAIYYKGQDGFLDVPIRYNIFFDEIEYKEPEKERIYALKPDTLLNRIIILEDTFVVASYQKVDKLIRGFFRSHVIGEISLLVKMEIEFREAQSETTHKMGVPARFMKKPDHYYLKLPAQPARPIKNTRNLISELGSHQEELSGYIKEHKISVKKDKDLAELITYFNSL